jgi:glycosyltransferase involved in cell wall biosynthesis
MRALLLYPFDNLRETGWGNSLRMRLVLAYLAERCDAVRALSPGPRSSRERVGGVEYVTVPWPFWRSLGWRLRAKWWRATTGLDGVTEREMLANFDRARAARPLRESVAAAIEEADIVFLKYPFWADLVLPLCRRRGIPCVVTAIDVHAVTAGRRPAAAALILERELAALRGADMAVTVSEEDRAVFAAHGVATRCLVNPIAPEACDREAAPGEVAGVRDRFHLGKGPLALFVGSRIVPNVEAVAELRRIAAECPEVTFVVAGRCAPPGRRGNVIALGLVSEADLGALYAAAALVVMPLRSGTGTSLKFVEALARGKAILATPVAARGYAAGEGEAILEPELLRFASHIRALLADPARRTALGEHARVLAREYDYRRVFEPYGKLLDRLRRSSTGATHGVSGV